MQLSASNADLVHAQASQAEEQAHKLATEQARQIQGLEQKIVELEHDAQQFEHMAKQVHARTRTSCLAQKHADVCPATSLLPGSVWGFVARLTELDPAMQAQTQHQQELSRLKVYWEDVIGQKDKRHQALVMDFQAACLRVFLPSW